MELTFLGTSCMVPTKERSVTSIYLEYNGTGLLFDCGEGTQRQMTIAKCSKTKIKHIFISHWHGDHVGGLLGLIQTLNREEGKKLYIYGPVETKMRLEAMLSSVYFDNSIELIIKEISAETLTTILDTPEYSVQAIDLDHGIPTLGFSFVEHDKRKVKSSELTQAGVPQGPHIGTLQEGNDLEYEGRTYTAEEYTYTVKGKKIAFVFDTAYTKNILTLADQADVMISESTYAKRHQENAATYKHLTVSQAAESATQAQVGSLYLLHFSQRYADLNELEEEAKLIFPETTLAYDFLKVKL